MKGLILLCGIALVSLLGVDAQSIGPLIINCFVSPPNAAYPYLAPNPGAPAVIRAYNETGGAFSVCNQAYVSYNVPTNVTGAYSTYNGWLFGGGQASDVATCQSALTSQLNALQQQYGIFGSVIYYKFSAVSCCQTEQCNDPAKVNNAAAGRQQPAWLVLLSAVMGVAILRTLWL